MKHEDDMPSKKKEAPELGLNGKPIVSMGRFFINNWWFEAFSDGTVTVGRVPMDVPKFTMTADDWASVVSSTCVDGQSSEIHMAVCDILKGKLPKAPKTVPTKKPDESKKE